MIQTTVFISLPTSRQRNLVDAPAFGIAEGIAQATSKVFAEQEQPPAP
jgi:hypothetical protein